MHLLRAACTAVVGEHLPPHALLHVLGSARLGTISPDSDLDAFCAGPATLSRDDFFARLTGELRATGELAHARAVPAALVPVLELSLAGVAVDLAYVALPDSAAAIATATSSAADLPAAWLAACGDELDAPSRLTLLGAADADELLGRARATCGVPRYRQLVQLLARWARCRGVHGNAHGYLGGFSWAVLAAWAAETFPGDAGDASLARLLEHLFTTFAAWDFHRPLALAGTAGDYQPARRREPLVLLAPAPPARNTARNVLRSTLTVLRQELVLARDALAKLPSGDRTAAALERALLVPFSPAPPFTGAGARALELSLRCAPADLLACRGWLDSQVLSLLLELERHFRIRPLALSPHPSPSPTAGGEPALHPIIRVYLAGLSLAPSAGSSPYRAARIASDRLAEQLLAWPDRPAGAELRCALVDAR